MVAVITFAIMLIAKIIISGLYLQFDSIQFPTPTLALAEDNKEETPEKPINPNQKAILLRVKEKKLEEKEKDLEQREERLLPLQKEIETKLEELNELQLTLTAYAKKIATQEKALMDTKLTHLVTLYSSMEPIRAVAIMDKLDTDILVRILGNMKGKTAGKIMALMKPEKGAMISERLSKLELVPPKKKK